MLPGKRAWEIIGGERGGGSKHVKEVEEREERDDLQEVEEKKEERRNGRRRDGEKHRRMTTTIWKRCRRGWGRGLEQIRKRVKEGGGG